MKFKYKVYKSIKELGPDNIANYNREVHRIAK